MLSSLRSQLYSYQKVLRGTPFKVSVIGVTRVTVFPLPEFSNTLYLADVPNLGLVPIGYAVYASEEGHDG
jgi:hypothetical protein